MSEAKSILNKRMLLIDVKRSQNHLPHMTYVYAYYLPRTGKVWLSKTRHIQRLIDNLRHLDTRQSVIDTFPKAVQTRLKEMADISIELYISSPSVLVSTPLAMELERIGALLKTATKEGQISEVVWVVTHRQTGYYKFVHTTEVDRSSRLIFESFVSSVKKSSPGSRCHEFASEHEVWLSVMCDFNVEVLIEAKNEREANVAINKYVRAKGGHLSLSTYGISKAALKAV